jgi:hypothetical protein
VSTYLQVSDKGRLAMVERETSGLGFDCAKLLRSKDVCYQNIATRLGYCFRVLCNRVGAPFRNWSLIRYYTEEETHRQRRCPLEVWWRWCDKRRDIVFQIGCVLPSGTWSGYISVFGFERSGRVLAHITKQCAKRLGRRYLTRPRNATRSSPPKERRRHDNTWLPLVRYDSF